MTEHQAVTVSDGGGGAGFDGAVWLNTGGTMNDIGGNTCHLCGAAKQFEHTFGSQRKRGWTTRREVGYTCGTYITISPEGKKSVILGRLP